MGPDGSDAKMRALQELLHPLQVQLQFGALTPIQYTELSRALMVPHGVLTTRSVRSLDTIV